METLLGILQQFVQIGYNLIDMSLDHFYLPSIIHFSAGIVTIYLVFLGIYWFVNKEFINPFDFKTTKFEKGFIRELIKYSSWGTIQQIVIFSSVYIASQYYDMSNWEKFSMAIIMFNILHIPNFQLIVATLGLSVYIYIPFYFFDMQPLIYYGILHAFGGTCYKQLDWEMRVLWTHPSVSKYFKK